jgi:hypothetical protein
MRALFGTITALMCVAVLGVGAASAAIDLQLQLENITTHQAGAQVTARPGDIVRLTLTLSNLTRTKTRADVTFVGSLPGVTVRATESTKLTGRQTKRHSEQMKVPAGFTGPLVAAVSARTADGSFDSASGGVVLTTPKTGGPSVAPSPFQRLFLETLARGIVHAFLADDGASTSFSAVKDLYR